MTRLPAPVQGALWMLFSAFCYVGSATMMRSLGNAYSPFMLTFIRSCIAVVMLMPLFLRTGGGVRLPPRFAMLSFSAALTYLAILCWFAGAANVPVANFFALQFTTPLFTILLATLVLRERNDPIAWIATAVGFGGVLVILRPGTIGISLGAVATLGSCVGYASVNTAIKSISRDVSAPAIVLWSNILMVPLSAPMAAYSWHTPAMVDWPVIVAISMLITIAFVTVTKAISLADARIVQPVNFMRMPAGAAVGWLVFSEFPDLWTWAGAVIIFIASTVAVGRGTRRA